MSEELYIVIRYDAPNGGERRKDSMQAHMDWSRENVGRFKVGGAIRPDADSPAVGSVAIVKATSVADARALMEADPFDKVGVYKSTEVLHYRAGMGDWLGGVKW